MNTSAYVDWNLHLNISIAARNHNFSSSKVFRDLLDLTAKKITPVLIRGILTEYQNHKSKEWKRVHYCPTEEQVDSYSKLHYMLKISISKLAFIGFLLFWDELLKLYSELNKKNISLKLVVSDSYEGYINKFKDLFILFRKRLNIIELE